MFVLAMGDKYLCNDEDGYTYLSEADDEGVMEFDTEESAQKLNSNWLQNRYKVMERDGE